ncbi:MAG: CHASE3 domain-containing protein [Gemmataceae bacterium]
MKSRDGINFIWIGAAVTLIVNAVVGIWFVVSIDRSQAIVTQTENTRAQIAEIFSEMKDAETGQRGFLMTVRQEFLEPYNRAYEKLPAKLDQLQVMFEGDSHQTAQFNDLRSYIDQRFKIMIESIQYAKQGKLEQARDVDRAIRGKAVMDKIRGICREIMDAETKSLEERKLDVRRKFRSTVAVNIIGTTLALAVILFSQFLVRQELKRRKRAEADLKLAFEHQESVIENRTKALTQTSQELLRSNQDLEKFAYVASHDLQEPLRKIQAFGDRLKKKATDLLDESSRDYVDRMQSAATRMRTLITDLLSYSRVTTHAIVFSPVDLNQIVNDVVLDLEFRREESQGQIEIGPLPTILADPTQMRQLFQNLIANALKFRHPDRPAHVRVRAYSASDLTAIAVPPPPASGWRIVLTDNGIGFDSIYSERIFELFQRLHGRGEYEGTGIGLAVCRKIMERHGGHIVAKSQPGIGSEFILDLPDLTNAQGVLPK